MTTKTLGLRLAGCVCVVLLGGCGDDAAPSTADGGPRIDLGGRDLGPDPADGFSPSVRCATNEECTPAMNAAPCALTFCDRVNGRCVTTGPDGDADGHADENCDPGLGPTAVRGDDCDDVDPMRFPGRPETCDPLGFDEDCDSRTVGGGRPGDGDADGDGFVSFTCTNRDDATGEVLPGPDCDDSNAEVHPRAVDGPPDTCNGVDDNCDGDVDPGCTCSADMPCGPSGVVFGGASICAMGVQRCSAGTLGMCEGAVFPRAETCEIERLDDDCDGLANETDVCECDDGSTGLCGGAPDGAHNDEPSGCRRGTRNCLAGRWQSCGGAVGPSPEACEGRIDEDCDGSLDEDCGCTDGATRPCGTDTGECTPGTQTCSAGGWGDCSGGIGPMPEVCDIDRRDENCDGNPNEGCACASGETRSCGVETGECIAGTEMCSGGVWSGSCTGGRGPTAEVCDGDDDDCNGTNDDGCSCTDGATRACGTDVGDCVAGIETCSGGLWGACSGVGPSPTEDCDGGDEDCDGMIDEGCGCTSGMTRVCGGGPPGSIRTPPAICLQGMQSCVGGAWGLCMGNVEPAAEVCDAARLDENCDGTRNEGCGVVEVDAGYDHTCARRTTGRVECWGWGEHGQLGNGTSGAGHRSLNPVVVTGLTDATQIEAGRESTCALRSTGRVACWGSNGFGQLGNGGTGISTTPVEVTGLTDAVEIAVGGRFACARRATGTILCWGDNAIGQLGIGVTGGTRTAPVAVTFTGAVDLEAGFDFACARTSGIGGLYCWGANGQGELGDGTTTSRPSPTVVGSYSGAIGAPSVLEMAAGFSHACARLSSTVTCWGANFYGQVGSGPAGGIPPVTSPTTVSGLTGAVELALGTVHSCARLSSGQLRCWGATQYGQLGDGSSGGPFGSTVPVIVSGVADATGITAGGGHTCAPRTSVQASCWGDNRQGQVGSGTASTPVLTPVPVAELY